MEIVLGAHDWHLLRPLFRDADWLLKIGGTLIVNCPDELRSACAWDMWALGAGRFVSTPTARTVQSTKVAARPDAKTDSSAWSIAVMSGGGNEARLERIFASVAEQRIPKVEVLIVGPVPKMSLPDFARHVPFAESPADPRFPITRKKNLVAQNACYENILLVHDRFRCGAGWYIEVNKLRSDWDVLVMRTVFEGMPGSRLADWSAYACGTADALVNERVATYDKVYPFDFRRLDVSELSYAAYSPFIAINGGAFAVKRHVLANVPLNPQLNWAEIEDGDWSRQLHLRGKVVSLAEKCVLESLSDGRHSSANASLIGRIAVGRRIGVYFSRFRKVCFTLVQKLLDRLNNRGDFFTQRGYFARRAATLTAPTSLDIQRVNWINIDTLHIRGFAENKDCLRDLFRELKAFVPSGKEVYFELATSGYSYFRRSGHRRNCESLCYELASYLGSDFECRFLLSTLQHNFVIGYHRTTELKCYPLNRVRIVLSDDTAGIRSFVTKLGVAQFVSADETCDAVLLIGNELELTDAQVWRDTYLRYGAVCASAAGARVLDGALLLAASEFERVVDGWTLDRTPACRQVFESALIFAGIHPFNLRATSPA